jgi:hypothetical protein
MNVTCQKHPTDIARENAAREAEMERRHKEQPDPKKVRRGREATQVSDPLPPAIAGNEHL